MYDITEFGQGEEPVKDNFLLQSKIYVSSNSDNNRLFEDSVVHDLDPAQELAFDLSGYLYSEITESNNLNILSSDPSAVRVSESVSSAPSVDTSNFDTALLGMSELPKFDDFASSTDGGSVWDTLTVNPEDIATEGYTETEVLEDGNSVGTSTSFSEPASPVVISSTSTTPTSSRPKPYSRGKKKEVVKGSQEYSDKRYRNNVAVRKSRAKAKERQKTTENRVNELSAENERLQKKIDLLTKELNVLKGLFVNVGAALPESFTKLFQS